MGNYAPRSRSQNARQQNWDPVNEFFHSSGVYSLAQISTAHFLNMGSRWLIVIGMILGFTPLAATHSWEYFQVSKKIERRVHTVKANRRSAKVLKRGKSRHGKVRSRKGRSNSFSARKLIRTK